MESVGTNYLLLGLLLLTPFTSWALIVVRQRRIGLRSVLFLILAQAAVLGITLAFLAVAPSPTPAPREPPPQGTWP